MRELYIYDKYRSAFRPVLENYHLRNTPFVEFLINHSSRVRVAAFDVRRSTFDIRDVVAKPVIIFGPKQGGKHYETTASPVTIVHRRKSC